MPANLHLVPRFRDRLSYLYVEHAVVEREANSVAIWRTDGDDLSKTQAPVCDLALLMLGPGTKISHAAVDVLARNNCLVAWTGEEAVRLYAFGTGGTHSAARLRKQAELASNPATRLEMTRRFYSLRFPEALDPNVTIEQLRGKEGLRVRDAYARLAAAWDVPWQGRNYDRNHWQGADPVNRALSAANACMYGICHAAILSMGFSPALGFVHVGKQLSFVYDISDLYKLEIAAPAAFMAVADGDHDIDRRVRLNLRDLFQKTRFLERVANDLIRLFGPDIDDIEDYDDDPSRPAPLVEGGPGGVNYCTSEEP